VTGGRPRDYPSMARLARALYETGLGPREVVRDCYGVELPEEFFVLHEADPELMFHSELEAGRPTVFAVEYYPTADSPVTRAADSLLAALHAHHTAHLAWLEQEDRATASHSGGGTVTEESLLVAQEFLLTLEDLRRKITSA
jgi:hypothetical protein